MAPKTAKDGLQERGENKGESGMKGREGGIEAERKQSREVQGVIGGT